MEGTEDTLTLGGVSITYTSCSVVTFTRPAWAKAGWKVRTHILCCVANDAWTLQCVTVWQTNSTAAVAAGGVAAAEPAHRRCRWPAV